MATLDEKLSRVENNIAASLEAAAEMGAEVPEGANSDSLPTLIRSIPQGGGASSWNDLPDRPVVMAGGDTLAWGGKTDGLYGVDVNGDGSLMFYHISDAAPSMGDFASGFSLGAIFYDGSAIEQTFEQTAINEMAPGFCADAGFNVAIVQEDNMDAGGIIFEKKGVYFAVSPTQFTASLTIPGYTGFATEKIDPAYLYQPDWEQTDEAAPDFVKNKPFGETVVMGDTLELYMTEEEYENFPAEDIIQENFLYYTSATPTVEDVSRGATLLSGDQVLPVTAMEADSNFWGLLVGDGILAYVVNVDNYELDGIVFPHAGMYVMDYFLHLGSTLIISGYTNFVKTEVIPLDVKYIPPLPYLTKDAPVFSSSVSMGRIADTEVGKNSTALGSYVIASGENSHAEGCYTTASGANSHAEGQQTKASGSRAHAEGTSTTASGGCSHAEGETTTASGVNSHAEGQQTKASGANSHAEGCWTIAAGERQHVQGIGNIEDTENKYAHIVGNGVLFGERSNAHTLDWDGNAWFAGSVEGTALILKSPNGTRFKITVSDDGVLNPAIL